MDYIIELLNWMGITDFIASFGADAISSLGDVFIDQISD